MIKKEKSCGAIIYKIEDNNIKILLLKHNVGHWSFPKGHVENNETEEETALREIKEETNLDVLIDTNFRRVSTYYPKENVIKDVVFFIGKQIDKNIKAVPQESEISELGWYLKEDALNIITYDNDKELLKEALDYLEKSGIK